MLIGRMIAGASERGNTKRRISVARLRTCGLSGVRLSCAGGGGGAQRTVGGKTENLLKQKYIICGLEALYSSSELYYPFSYYYPPPGYQAVPCGKVFSFSLFHNTPPVSPPPTPARALSTRTFLRAVRT
jgi:hypothetical protein